MTEPVLTERHLNRALLARQLLLDRAELPLTAAVERCAGLQTQYAPSAYIALWSRLRDFERPALTRALEERRAVQATLMRSTIHVVSAADYHPLAVATRQARREGWLRAARHQIDGVDLEGVAALVRGHLAGRPRRAAEIKRLLDDRGLSVPMTGVLTWVDIVRVPPSGTWEQRRADLYGLAEEWLEPVDVSMEEALDHLVRRYLGGFGPASLKDVANWAALPVATLRPAVERLGLRTYRDERGAKLLDLPDADLPDAGAPAPVRFLPTWDATLLAHARRTQVLPESYRPLVFSTRTPQSVPTFLVDGAVAGKWRYEDGQVRLEPFHPLHAGVLEELEEEGRRLAAFHAAAAR